MDSSKNHGLCSSGCGFYANDATFGFCSKCYRDHLFASRITETSPRLSSILGSGGVESKEDCASSVTEHDKMKTKKQRCSKCERKVGLAMGEMKCRCNGVFCAAHRLPEDHACTFDYRTAGRLLLEKANPLIKADKLNSM